ncbi:Tat pathway signal sequence domain protein [Synechococcus sp. PCC 7335]|uniref:hypothetical protein n=1 Tax=Synechococcus sp. (strain ATCC 29403 / PCC 7335) TaxID=91464 RepID=UPI00017EBCC8|nr:hypothetical protein [Synechococcus sp. PCC 7335]EDX83259.1 Tat pathway signal sequence domain protein [Synechococcus sp. PCC 7335]
MFHKESINRRRPHLVASIEREDHTLPSRKRQGLGVKRRHFMKLALAGVGLALPHLVQAYRHEDSAEAIAWLPAATVEISLVNGSFNLCEDIQGDLRAQNTSSRTHSGIVSYDIFDLDTGRKEVSEIVRLVIDPGDNQFSFSCSGCQTIGNKRLTITTAYGSQHADFVVVSA